MMGEETSHVLFAQRPDECGILLDAICDHDSLSTARIPWPSRTASPHVEHQVMFFSRPFPLLSQDLFSTTSVPPPLQLAPRSPDILAHQCNAATPPSSLSRPGPLGALLTSWEQKRVCVAGRGECSDAKCCQLSPTCRRKLVSERHVVCRVTHLRCPHYFPASPGTFNTE